MTGIVVYFNPKGTKTVDAPPPAAAPPPPKKSEAAYMPPPHSVPIAAAAKMHTDVVAPRTRLVPSASDCEKVTAAHMMPTPLAI